MDINDLESRGAHLRHGLKTGLATVLAYGLTELLQLPMGFWAVLTAVIVMQVNVADSIEMCVYRFTGTALGAGMGLAMLLLTPHEEAYMAMALFVSVAFCAYMTRYSSRYRMAAITVVIVLLAGAGEPDPLQFSLYRVFEIAVGVICAFLVSVLLWPARAGAALRMRLQVHFTRAAELYEEISEAFLSRQASLPDDFLAELDHEVRQNRELLHKALRHERLFYNDHVAQLAQLTELLTRCLEHMHALLGAVNTPQGPGFTLIMENELRELAHAVQAVMRCLGEGSPPNLAALRKQLATVQLRLQELREAGKTQRFHLNKLLQVLAFIHNTQALAQDLLRVQQSLNAENNSLPKP